jgi:choline dehydrogenase-like flavoprotein
MGHDQHYDVVIIGTGAGGGTLGHRLATYGTKVLWLERGSFLPRERDNWQTEAVFVRGKAVHLSIYEKNNVEGVKRLRHKLDGMLSQLGMHEHHLLDRSLYLHKSMPIGATAHQAGTVPLRHRSRRERARCELQSARRGQPLRGGHQLFPSIGAVNPSLTAIANALRVGDHLTERLA